MILRGELARGDVALVDVEDGRIGGRLGATVRASARRLELPSPSMSGETELTGPDLTKGVDERDVPEGGIARRARARRAGAARAARARTSSPSARSALTTADRSARASSSATRCAARGITRASLSARAPPLRAPALEPIACFDVATQRRQARRCSASAARSRRSSRGGGPSSVVIVGAGAAGNACAETLRRPATRGPSRCFGAEATTPVDRPNLSKDYLAGTAPEEWMRLRDEDFYASAWHRAALGTRVTKIDVARRRVHLDGGATRDYGALVLATGAQPNRLADPGRGPAARLHAADAGRQPGHHRAAVEREARGRRRRELHRARGRREPARARPRGGRRRQGEACRSPACSATRSAPSCKRCTRSTASASTSATSPARDRRVVGRPRRRRARIEADLVVLGVGVTPDLALAEAAGLDGRSRRRRGRVRCARARPTCGPRATSRGGPTRGQASASASSTGSSPSAWGRLRPGTCSAGT